MIDTSKNGDVLVTLIDFGHAKKFIDSKNNHILSGQKTKSFQGNIMHASVE